MAQPTLTTQQLVNYYANLLILQYLQKPNAYASIQTQVTPIILPQVSIQQITFSGVAASGHFTLSYGTLTTGTLNWNSTATNIQTALRLLSGLSTITVTGSIASESLIVTFTGVAGVATQLVFATNSLLTAGAVSVVPTILETDVTLPIAVQNAFNVTGTSPAVGVQLDVIGKYAGVSRSGFGSQGQAITLDDADFTTLIQLATVTNSAGSSLATIQALINQFFPGEILTFDYKNMRMSYLVNSSIGSQDLIQLVITNNLLPKPMGVQLSVTVYKPIINSFFGFRTYDLPQLNAKPFNTYDSYITSWTWLSYTDGVGIS